MKIEANLKVWEAFQQDVAHGRACIDKQTCKDLDLSVGDVIEIVGMKTTVAKVWKGHTDEDKEIIRIDNIVRHNAGVKPGEHVKIRKAEVREAKDVTVASETSERPQVQFGTYYETLLKKSLLKQPLINGDIVMIPGKDLLGSPLPFVVINTHPSGIVSVNEKTAVHIKE